MNREGVINYVKEVRGSPLVWGELDCTLFPLKCLDVLQEKNTAEKLLSQWVDMDGAINYSRKNNLTLESYLTDNGCVEIETNYQQTGDFLMLHTDTVIDKYEWLSAAVCLGVHSAMCTDEGVRVYKTSAIEYIKILGIR